MAFDGEAVDSSGNGLAVLPHQCDPFADQFTAWSEEPVTVAEKLTVPLGVVLTEGGVIDTRTPPEDDEPPPPPHATHRIAIRIMASILMAA